MLRSNNSALRISARTRTCCSFYPEDTQKSTHSYKRSSALSAALLNSQAVAMAAVSDDCHTALGLLAAARTCKARERPTDKARQGRYFEPESAHTQRISERLLA